MLILLPPHRWAFQYLNHEGKSAHRMVVVESLQFLPADHDYYPLAWGLNALCLDRQARRTFALHRISGQVTEVITPDYRDPATRKGNLPSLAQVTDAVGPKGEGPFIGKEEFERFRSVAELMADLNDAEDRN